MSEYQQDDDASTYDPQECADCKAWLKRIEDAAKFDESSKRQIALDRRYARGDAGNFEINVNMCGSYIDILKSILYAKNPDLNVQPSEATTPPPMADIIEMAREKIGQDPATHAMMEKVGMQAAMQAQSAKEQAMQGAQTAALDPQVKMKVALAAADPNQSPEEIGERAAQAWLNEKIKAEAKQIMEPHRKRLADAKQFGKTIELVVSNLWKKGNLKLQARQQVGSAITVGRGWLKVTWQERTGRDPLVEKSIRDAQDQLARLDLLQEELAEGEANNDDEQRAKIEQLLQGLEEKVEIIIARGLAVDFVRAEDVQVSTDLATLENYVDAGWIAHRLFKTVDSAKAEFPKIADKLKNASTYRQKKPLDPFETRHIGEAATDIDAKEADQFTLNSAGGDNSIGEGNVCVWEVQDKESGMILTLVEGLDVYARDPYPAIGTTRFYNLFMLALIWTDGERHPQSLIKRSSSLFDDVNRLYSNRAMHRRRSIPKLAFNSTGLEPTEIDKIQKAGTGEIVGIKAISPDAKISELVAPMQYAKVDEGLYDDTPQIRKLEIIWAIQEALASSIATTKTATEAEIQQTGTNARSSYKRAAIDEMMDDLAQYTTEIALQKMSFDDVKAIAGPWAFWPQGLSIQDMGALVTVQIKGGSSGKPDTSAQQQAWSVTMPVLKDAIMSVGQLRASEPSDIADCIEELVTETLSRTGDHLDPARFLPQSPSNEPGAMPTQPQGQAAAQLQPGAPMPPMPAQQTPPTNPNVLPVPHSGHALDQQGHIQQPGVQH
jgi:hypothetical protein